MEVFWKLVKGELRQQLVSHAEEFNVDLMHQGDQKVQQPGITHKGAAAGDDLDLPFTIFGLKRDISNAWQMHKEGLLIKLNELGIKGKLFNWVFNFKQ